MAKKNIIRASKRDIDIIVAATLGCSSCKPESFKNQDMPAQRDALGRGTYPGLMQGAMDQRSTKRTT